MLIVVTGAGSQKPIAVDHSDILGVHDLRKSFGGVWARTQLVLRSTKTRIWCVESFEDILADVRAAELGILRPAATAV